MHRNFIEIHENRYKMPYLLKACTRKKFRWKIACNCPELIKLAQNHCFHKKKLWFTSISNTPKTNTANYYYITQVLFIISIWRKFKNCTEISNVCWNVSPMQLNCCLFCLTIESVSDKITFVTHRFVSMPYRHICDFYTIQTIPSYFRISYTTNLRYSFPNYFRTKFVVSS